MLQRLLSFSRRHHKICIICLKLGQIILRFLWNGPIRKYVLLTQHILLIHIREALKLFEFLIEVCVVSCFALILTPSGARDQIIYVFLISEEVLRRWIISWTHKLSISIIVPLTESLSQRRQRSAMLWLLISRNSTKSIAFGFED